MKLSLLRYKRDLLRLTRNTRIPFYQTVRVPRLSLWRAAHVPRVVHPLSKMKH